MGSLGTTGRIVKRVALAATCVFIAITAASLRWGVSWWQATPQSNQHVVVAALRFHYYCDTPGYSQATLRQLDPQDQPGWKVYRVESPFDTRAFWPESPWLPSLSRRLLSRGQILRITIPLWIFILPPFLITAALWYRDRRRRPPDQCRMCGYNLTGNLSGICPECGTLLADAVPPHQRVPRNVSRLAMVLCVVASALLAAGFFTTFRSGLAWQWDLTGSDPARAERAVIIGFWQGAAGIEWASDEPGLRDRPPTHHELEASLKERGDGSRRTIWFVETWLDRDWGYVAMPLWMPMVACMALTCLFWARQRRSRPSQVPGLPASPR